MAKGSRKYNENGLNPQQQKFADRYIINGGNSADAYRYAYQNADPKKATQNGCDLLRRNPRITQYIQQEQAKLNKQVVAKGIADRETLIQWLTDIITGEKVVTDVAERCVGGKLNGQMKEKTISKEWAVGMLCKILGYDKSENQTNITNNTLNVIVSGGTTPTADDEQ